MLFENGAGEKKKLRWGGLPRPIPFLYVQQSVEKRSIQTPSLSQPPPPTHLSKYAHCFTAILREDLGLALDKGLMINGMQSEGLAQMMLLQL